MFVNKAFVLMTLWFFLVCQVTNEDGTLDSQGLSLTTVRETPLLEFLTQ